MKRKNEVAAKPLGSVTQDLMIHSNRKRGGNRELQYKASVNLDSLHGVTHL